MKALDLIIIGAGPIGLACGIEASRKGLSYLIIEKGTLVNSIYHYPKNMTFFSTSDRLEIGGVPFISHGVKPTRTEALEYYTRVASSWELNVRLYEKVMKILKKSKGFELITDKSTYLATNLIISTGFYDLPYLLNIPGEDLPKVKHYYDEPYPYFKQKIVVIGAANSAVDAALETYRKGAEVTMVVREPEISPSVKYWVRPDVENRIREGSIKAYFNAYLEAIHQDHVRVVTPESAFDLENDFVLAMTGYQIDFALLESIGVEIGLDKMKTPVYNERTQETNIPGVYLAGVVCGGLQTNKWFIENSRIHAPCIIEHIAHKISNS
jgi:thioredoxin reductase (NADPH)